MLPVNKAPPLNENLFTLRCKLHSFKTNSTINARTKSTQFSACTTSSESYSSAGVFVGICLRAAIQNTESDKAFRRQSSSLVPFTRLRSNVLISGCSYKPGRDSQITAGTALFGPPRTRPFIFFGPGVKAEKDCNLNAAFVRRCRQLESDDVLCFSWNEFPSGEICHSGVTIARPVSQLRLNV